MRFAAMRTIDITDTATGIRITHQALPAALMGLVFAAGFAFMVFVLAKADFRRVTCLPPIDELPDFAKLGPIGLSIGGGLAVMALPIMRGVRIL